MNGNTYNQKEKSKILGQIMRKEYPENLQFTGHIENKGAWETMWNLHFV